MLFQPEHGGGEFWRYSDLVKAFKFKPCFLTAQLLAEFLGGQWRAQLRGQPWVFQHGEIQTLSPPSHILSLGNFFRELVEPQQGIMQLILTFAILKYYLILTLPFKHKYQLDCKLLIRNSIDPSVVFKPVNQVTLPFHISLEILYFIKSLLPINIF